MPERKPRKPKTTEQNTRPLLGQYGLSLTTDRDEGGYTARLQVEDTEKRTVVLTFEFSLRKENDRMTLSAKGSEADFWELVLKVLERITD